MTDQSSWPMSPVLRWQRYGWRTNQAISCWSSVQYSLSFQSHCYPTEASRDAPVTTDIGFWGYLHIGMLTKEGQWQYLDFTEIYLRLFRDYLVFVQIVTHCFPALSMRYFNIYSSITVTSTARFSWLSLLRCINITDLLTIVILIMELYCQWLIQQLIRPRKYFMIKTVRMSKMINNR